MSGLNILVDVNVPLDRIDIHCYKLNLDQLVNLFQKLRKEGRSALAAIFQLWHYLQASGEDSHIQNFSSEL